MFDSRSLRRKLVNLIPGDARQQLQNVLTVEWDTHKTVLVEVPGAAGSQHSPDVEMEGLGLNRNNEREGYGRLDEDHDEDHDAYNSNLAIEPPRSGSGNYFNRPIPRPKPPRQPSSDKRLPDIPSQNRRQEEVANNPFASDDDFAPNSSNRFIQPNRESGMGGASSPSSRARSRTIEEGWNTFSNPYAAEEGAAGRGEKMGDSWVKGKEPNSPTSSRGTRDSAQTSVEENPFR